MPPQKTSSARGLAVEMLCLWAATRSSMDLLFQEAAPELAKIDRGLVKALVYGVLRQKEYLDHILRHFSSHPLRKMQKRTLMTLRIGAYQLLFLDRIPESAAVNATVNTLKEVRQPPWLLGFVNGILRNLARERANLPSPDAVAQAEPPILNHPAWLIERWQARFGPERARAICKINNSEALLTLRANNQRSSQALLLAQMEKSGITVQRGLYSPQALQVLDFPGGINALPGYSEGLFQVQDEAAQLASLLLGPFTGPAKQQYRVLDACAGLGGKTSHLAELLPFDAELTAIEPDIRRFRLLKDNLTRLGLTRQVRPLCRTLQGFAAEGPPAFNAILLDAPCSGTGVIRRRPDIRWNRQPEDLPRQQRLQRELLHAAASLLKPGGVLVYAVCSLEAEETNECVARFLNEHPHCALQNAAEFLPGASRKLMDADGFFSAAPDQGLDGFFAARLCDQRGL